MPEFMKVLGVFFKLKMQEIWQGLRIFGVLICSLCVCFVFVWCIGFMSIAFISPCADIFHDSMTRGPWYGAPFEVGCACFVIVLIIVWMWFLGHTVCKWLRSNWDTARDIVSTK